MEIYEYLKRDHEQIKELLSELVSLNEDDDYRYVLLEQIKSELIPHSRAEESVFYNTLRAINADKAVVRHGYKEHLAAETLLRSLQVMDKMNLDWKETAIKFKDALEHHIQDEETEIFNEAKRAFSAEEANAIGEAFVQLKPKVSQGDVMSSTLDMVINMMPPRISEKIRGLGSNEKSV
jgi:hemerythrin-like domain-containing protein